ncbi:MAG: hypothetical protein AAFR00_00330 [Pseudomonadota bacterium]
MSVIKTLCYFTGRVEVTIEYPLSPFIVIQNIVIVGSSGKHWDWQSKTTDFSRIARRRPATPDPKQTKIMVVWIDGRCGGGWQGFLGTAVAPSGGSVPCKWAGFSACRPKNGRREGTSRDS